MDAAISLLQEMWATFALDKARTLGELGIHPITSWTLVASCSWHGRQTLDLIESTEEPGENEWIKCDGCAMRTVTRWLPVTAHERR